MEDCQESALSSSFEHFFLLLEEMKAKKLNESHLNDTIASLQAENLKLKESNICLEKKAAEQQNKIERLTLKCQAPAANDTELCSTREQLLESSSKMLEEENTKLSQTIAELQVQLLHANEKHSLDQEEWQYHRQKMEKLTEFVGQLLEKAATLEAQMQQVEQASERVAPTVASFVRRCTSLQLAYRHGECRIAELSARLSDLQQQAVAKETKIASLQASVQSLQSENESVEKMLKERGDEMSETGRRCEQLQKKAAKLETELLESQRIVREQTELLERQHSSGEAASGAEGEVDGELDGEVEGEVDDKVDGEVDATE